MYDAGTLAGTEVAYQRTPEDKAREMAMWRAKLNENLPKGYEGSGSLEYFTGLAGLGLGTYLATKSGPLVKGAWNLAKKGAKSLFKGKAPQVTQTIADLEAQAVKAAEVAYAEAEAAGATAEEAIDAAHTAYSQIQATVDASAQVANTSKKFEGLRNILSKPVTQVGLYGAGWAGINAATGIFNPPQIMTPLQESVSSSKGNDTTPVVQPPLVNTDSTARLKQDTIDKIGFLKQYFPNYTDDQILNELRTSPETFVSFFPTVSDSAKTDSIRVADSTAAAQAAAQAQAQAAAQAAAAANANNAKGKTLRVKGVTGGGGSSPQKLSKDDILENKSQRTEDDEYLYGYRLGGSSLTRYADVGQTNTQYRKESKISSNDDYDVIPVSQDINYKFGKQQYDANLGTYTIIDPDTGRSIPLDLTDFMNRQGDLVNEYDGGKDKWLTDATSRNEATRKKASGWFQRRYDKWREENGLPKYFFGNSSEYTGYDDKFGIYTFSAPGIKKKVKQPETKVETKKEEEPIVANNPEPPRPGFQSPTGYGLGDWFPSDVAAMTAAASMRIPDYKGYYGIGTPSRMQPVYINENYEPIAAVTQTIEGMGTGPEARASALGVTGKGLKAASDIQQQTRALNQDQFLKTQAVNVQNENQFALNNIKETSDYVNFLNAAAKDDAINQNAKLAQEVGAFSKGYNNVLNQMLTNASYPYQFQTPTSIAVNPTLRSIYDSPITGSGSGASYDEVFDFYHKRFSDPSSGLSKKEAIDAANSSARNYLNTIYQRNRSTGTRGAMLSPFEV